MIEPLDSFLNAAVLAHFAELSNSVSALVVDAGKRTAFADFENKFLSVARRLRQIILLKPTITQEQFRCVLREMQRSLTAATTGSLNELSVDELFQLAHLLKLHCELTDLIDPL